MQAEPGGKAYSHREYVIDRAKRIQRMFAELRNSKELQKNFFKDPQSVAERFDVTFSGEETYAIKAIERVDLDSLQERLVFNPLAVFDANCHCAMSGMVPINTNPE